MPRPPGLAASAALVLLCLGAAAPAAPDHDGTVPPQQATAAQETKQKKPPSAKLAEPWPDAAKLSERRAEAEALPLFKEDVPLPFTLEADFKAISRDRDPESTKEYPGTLTVTDQQEAAVTIPVTLTTRGKSSLNPRVCEFVPLRIDLPEKEVKGTVFEGQQALKLVTHCENGRGFDQYVLLEHLAYRIFNVLTPRSFRTRLAAATYVEVSNHKPLFTRHAMFIEDDGDLARRMEGRVVEMPRLLFSNLDQESLMTLMLFQYMIGNTDISIWALHNISLVTTPARVFHPITWDFDMAGLVAPPHAIPNPRLKLISVKDRLYRGPCLSLAELEPHLAVFRTTQADVLALIDAIPDLDKSRRNTARSFLNEFYSLLGRQDRLKRELVDKCRPAPTM